MSHSIDVVPDLPKRRAMGSLYRDVLDTMRAAGQLESVRAAVRPATAKVMDDPPWALGWVDTAEWDDTLEALRRVQGRDACVAAGLAVARRQAGSLLKPLLRTLVGLSGSSPATVYANLDGLYNVTSRGVRLAWEPAGDDHGTMLLRTCDVPPDGVLDFIEGTLHFATELCEMIATLRRVPAPSGVTCAWSVRWRRRAA